jgi:chromosome segregation ATPase
MPLNPRKVWDGIFSCVRPGGEKPAKEDGPTPTSALQVLESELGEERAKCARLEQEYQRARVEADAFAEAKGKLKDETQKLKELLEAREKEAGHKDASMHRLERDMSEMQIKVSQVGRGMGSTFSN